MVVEMRDGGATLRQVADELNRRGIKGHKGGQWHAASVRQVLLRADGATPTKPSATSGPSAAPLALPF